MVDNKLLPKLSQNLLEILDNDEEYYDITIEVGTDPYIKVFRAHMNILNYRSPYLKRILSTNKKKNDGILTHIKLPNILPEIFQVVLRYIYGGKLSLEEYDTLDIIKTLVASNELGLQELIPPLESFLIKRKKKWIEQNFNLIYQTSFENDSFLKLKKYCTDLIFRDPDKIFNSLNFSSIPEKLLVLIIQSDNLKMNEIQVWEYILKWGLAQNPELSSDPTNYSKDDFDILKNTLQQCIPFIKFNNLTSKEFSDKVTPYKKVFPKELYKNLLKDFLNNNSKPIKNSEVHLNYINSKIITFQHSELISKWIDRLEMTDNLVSSPYEFKLLFRGSRDGLTCRKFHEICDNKSRTVIIIKIKDSDEIFGGYNPIRWKSDNSYGITKDSFIFSFNNYKNIKIDNKTDGNSDDYSYELQILDRMRSREESLDDKRYYAGLDNEIPRYTKGSSRVESLDIYMKGNSKVESLDNEIPRYTRRSSPYDEIIQRYTKGSSKVESLDDEIPRYTKRRSALEKYTRLIHDNKISMEILDDEIDDSGYMITSSKMESLETPEGYTIKDDSKNYNNDNHTENYILSRVKDEKKAICNNPKYGPSFGEGDLLLQIFDQLKVSCKKNSYENPIRKTKTNDMHNVEEFEVFQIV